MLICLSTLTKLLTRTLKTVLNTQTLAVHTHRTNLQIYKITLVAKNKLVINTLSLNY